MTGELCELAVHFWIGACFLSYFPRIDGLGKCEIREVKKRKQREKCQQEIAMGEVQVGCMGYDSCVMMRCDVMT